MNLIYNWNKQGKIDFFINHQKKFLSLEPNSLSSSFYDTALGSFGLDGYVQLIRLVTISPFRISNRLSVWAVKVDEEQSIVSFLLPPFFPQVSSMFPSLKANWILYAKWNESDYKVRSLCLKRVGKWTMCPTTHTKPRRVISHFNTQLLPLVVTAKSVKVYGL